MTEPNQPYAGETCSASRHVLAMAADILRDGHCQHIVDEPKHCAESMLATVEALWAARNAARATAADHVGDANKMVPGGWLCEIIEADFEHNTVTLKMNHYGYIVGAGPHYLVPADAAPQPVSAVEVPMPKLHDFGHHDGWRWRSRKACDEADVRTYGDAREAAGYAAGVAAGGKDAERYRWLRDKSPPTWMAQVEDLPLFKGDFDSAIDYEINAALRGEVK